MKSTPNGLRKLVVSLMIPMMVTSGVATLPELALAKAGTDPLRSIIIARH